MLLAKELEKAQSDLEGQRRKRAETVQTAKAEFRRRLSEKVSIQWRIVTNSSLAEHES